MGGEDCPHGIMGLVIPPIGRTRQASSPTPSFLPSGFATGKWEACLCEPGVDVALGGRHSGPAVRDASVRERLEEVNQRLLLARACALPGQLPQLRAPLRCFACELIEPCGTCTFHTVSQLLDNHSHRTGASNTIHSQRYQVFRGRSH